MFIAVTMTVGFAYADEVKFPTLTTDGMVDYDLKTFYPTNSTYIVQISILYEVPMTIELPERITWFSLDGTAHFVSLQDEMRMIYFPAEEEKTISPTSALTNEDIERILADKRKELSEQDSSGFSKLRSCLVEFEEEEPVRFAAWDRIASLSEFIIPDQWINEDHYSRADLEAQKKWVICEALKKYKYVGAWEANKIIDGHELGEPLDTSDSPDTQDVTELAIEFEQMRAEAFQCSAQGKSQGLCLNYLAGDNYVKPEPKIPDWYNEYREARDVPIDLQLALDVAMLSQCDNYYKLYNATGAIELPSWLEHCE